MRSDQPARCSFLLFVLVPFLVTLLTPAALVAAQSGDDLGWVLFDREQFDGNTALDADGDVQLFWKIGDEYSTYGIASRSEGYLALGFSETGAMTGADIAVGYKDSDGEFVLENRFAPGFITPELSVDQESNIRFREGDQKDGVTAFVFEKKNKADCLQKQVDVTTESWQWFIYAFSDENTFAVHEEGKNGNKFVKLGTFETVFINEVRDVNDTEEFTIIQPEVTIPTAETTYCYSLHKLPAGEKNFILSERPSVSSDLLHHMVLYTCWDLPEETKAMVDQEPNCDYENFLNPCTGFLKAWAPGMTGLTYELGFGKPFGSDSFEYVMLETHYNNPEGREDETDSSGYTFFYNNKPVENEIRALTLGEIQITGWELEPGKEIVARTTVCTPECTQKWPSEGINAVSVFFHMHKRGRNQRVQIIRDGQEIDTLSIRNFEYEYQFSKSLGEVRLLPGDTLITTCEWDTSEDEEPVPGGFASKEEMCLVWIDFYPANDVLICSQIDRGDISGSPINGTVALCVEAGMSWTESVVESEFPIAEFQGLLDSGNNCSASAIENEEASSTSSTVAASTTSIDSSASSAFLSVYRLLFTIIASLLFYL